MQFHDFLQYQCRKTELALLEAFNDRRGYKHSDKTNPKVVLQDLAKAPSYRG